MRNNDCSKLEKLAVKAENLAKENFTKEKIYLLFPHIIIGLHGQLWVSFHPSLPMVVDLKLLLPSALRLCSFNKQ